MTCSLKEISQRMDIRIILFFCSFVYFLVSIVALPVVPDKNAEQTVDHKEEEKIDKEIDDLVVFWRSVLSFNAFLSYVLCFRVSNTDDIFNKWSKRSRRTKTSPESSRMCLRMRSKWVHWPLNDFDWPLNEWQNGAIARELDFVNHNVRNQLDELKRIEMDRLRALAKRDKQMQDGQGEDTDGRRWRTLGADSSALSLGLTNISWD